MRGKKMKQMTNPLPLHPLIGFRAIGLTKRGDPIWPMLGGSEDADPQPESETPEGESDEAPAPKSNWKNFDSKDDFDEFVSGVVEKRLARERKKFDPVVSERDTLKAEVEELRPLKTAQQTDTERWEQEKLSFSKELEDLRAFRSKAERSDLIREIAEEKGLPAKFVKWVAGEDTDSITSSVDDLLNDLSEVGQSPKKPAQRKPKESDGDQPGSKGFSGGGGEEDGFSVDNLLKKVREQRGATYAH